MFEDPTLAPIDPRYEPHLVLHDRRFKLYEILKQIGMSERSLVPLQTRVDEIHSQLIGLRKAEESLHKVLNKAAETHGDRAPHEVAPSVEGLAKLRLDIKDRLEALDKALDNRDRAEWELSKLWEAAGQLDEIIAELTDALEARLPSDRSHDLDEASARLRRLVDELAEAETVLHSAIDDATKAATEAGDDPEDEHVPKEVAARLAELEAKVQFLYLDCSRIYGALEKWLVCQSGATTVEDLVRAPRVAFEALFGRRQPRLPPAR
jgi:predicted component of type VI protein secretion system